MEEEEEEEVDRTPKDNNNNNNSSCLFLYFGYVPFGSPKTDRWSMWMVYNPTVRIRELLTMPDETSVASSTTLFLLYIFSYSLIFHYCNPSFFFPLSLSICLFLCLKFQFHLICFLVFPLLLISRLRSRSLVLRIQSSIST